MTKLQLLEQERVEALRNDMKYRKQIISSLIGSIKKAAIDRKMTDNITDELANEVLLKEKKTVQEMIDSCPKLRIDLLDLYNERLAIVNEFAPTMLDADEIAMELAMFCELEGLDLVKANKVAIMRGFMPTMKGRAEGRLVNQIITEALK